MTSARIKKARFTQKGKWFKGNWNFQYKPRTEDGNKANSTKPNTILRY